MKNVWRLWTKNKPVVWVNVHNEEFLLSLSKASFSLESQIFTYSDARSPFAEIIPPKKLSLTFKIPCELFVVAWYIKKIVSAKARPDAALKSRMYLKTQGFNNLLDLICNPLQPEATSRVSEDFFTTHVKPSKLLEKLKSLELNPRKFWS
jgi:hypothetical protein